MFQSGNRPFVAREVATCGATKPPGPRLPEQLIDVSRHIAVPQLHRDQGGNGRVAMLHDGRVKSLSVHSRRQATFPAIIAA
jgi:hypothetical protein